MIWDRDQHGQPSFHQTQPGLGAHPGQGGRCPGSQLRDVCPCPLALRGGGPATTPATLFYITSDLTQGPETRSRTVTAKASSAAKAAKAAGPRSGPRVLAPGRRRGPVRASGPQRWCEAGSLAAPRGSRRRSGVLQTGRPPGPTRVALPSPPAPLRPSSPPAVRGHRPHHRPRPGRAGPARELHRGEPHAARPGRQRQHGAPAPALLTRPLGGPRRWRAPCCCPRGGGAEPTWSRLDPSSQGGAWAGIGHVTSLLEAPRTLALRMPAPRPCRRARPSQQGEVDPHRPPLHSLDITGRASFPVHSGAGREQTCPRSDHRQTRRKCCNLLRVN